MSWNKAHSFENQIYIIVCLNSYILFLSYFLDNKNVHDCGHMIHHMTSCHKPRI